MTRKNSLLGAILAVSLATTSAYAVVVDTVQVNFDRLGQNVAHGIKELGLANALKLEFKNGVTLTVLDTAALYAHPVMAKLLGADFGKGRVDFKLISADLDLALREAGYAMAHPLSDNDLAAFAAGFAKVIRVKTPPSRFDLAMASMAVALTDMVRRGKHAMQGGTAVGVTFGAA